MTGRRVAVVYLAGLALGVAVGWTVRELRCSCNDHPAEG